MPEPVGEERAAQIIASIARHYSVAPGLTKSQLAEHKRRLACPACATASPSVAAGVTADAAGQ